MHIAANKPSGLTAKDVPEAAIAMERKIAAEKAAESGKPPEIVTKMVEGSVAKYLKEAVDNMTPFYQHWKQKYDERIMSPSENFC